MIEVTAIGELLIDFTFKSSDHDGYPTMAAHPGGAPANYLAALAKYGVNAALLAKVGNDKFGRLLADTIRNAGIDTRGLVFDDSVFTTLAFVTLDENGNREFSFARKPGADTQITFAEIPAELIDEVKVFHFGTLSLTDEPACTATRMAVARAREKGRLITFDPNLRKPLWKSLDTAKEQILWGLSQADVVKISDEEITFLFNCSCAEGAEKLIREFGVSLVFVTQGKDGCLYSNGFYTGHVENFNEGIITIDTTGAGDIFFGSAVSRMLHIGKAPSALSEQELTGIATFACAAASLSTEKYGGITSVPEEDEVLRLMETRSL